VGIAFTGAALFLLGITHVVAVAAAVFVLGVVAAFAMAHSAPPSGPGVSELVAVEDALAALRDEASATASVLERIAQRQVMWRGAVREPGDRAART